jgi:hypothetical protein
LLAHLLPSCLPSTRCFAAAGFLRLYSLVPEVDGSRQAGADSAPLTILHADLLSSFWVLGHLVMPLLLQAAQQQHQQVGWVKSGAACWACSTSGSCGRAFFRGPAVASVACPANRTLAHPNKLLCSSAKQPTTPAGPVPAGAQPGAARAVQPTQDA